MFTLPNDENFVDMICLVSNDRLQTSVSKRIGQWTELV